MKLQDADQNFKDFSAKASDQTRQLSLAAIGIVWILKTDIGAGRYVVPPRLELVAFLAAVALGLDFLQYAYAAILWGIFHQIKEKELGRGSEKDFGINPKWNWPTKVFFYLKLTAMVLSWTVLIRYFVTILVG